MGYHDLRMYLCIVEDLRSVTYTNYVQAEIQQNYGVLP